MASSLAGDEVFMRPKFVTAVLSLSLLLCVGMWGLKTAVDAPKVKDSRETAAQAISLPLTTAVKRIKVSVTANSSTPEQERAVIAAKIEHLTQLSLRRDPASLSEIFAALKCPDREVREAAIDATTQVGDSNAIPMLKEASEMVDDPEEKIAFLEAMEFLAVPPLTFDMVPVKSPERTEAAERRRAFRRAEREDAYHGMAQARSSAETLRPESIAK